MKEITIKNNGIVSQNFLDDWCNKHPKLTTTGIVLVFFAPIAKKIYPDIKRGAKHVFDSWMAYRNYKLNVIKQPDCTDYIDATASTYVDESTIV